MMKTDTMSRRCLGSVLGFVMLLGAACESRRLGTMSPPDANVPNCTGHGCGAPPLCGVGCRETCGCCPCAPGERNGDLVCTAQGCYAPAPASDAGSDSDSDSAGGDARSDGDGRDGGNDSGGSIDAGGDVCALPFETGPCTAAFSVYAFVNGACVKRTYGGCQGNGNRFASWEECVATCVGPPTPGGCPPNRIDREICLACGPAGGCSKMATVCTLVCSEQPAGGPSVCEGPLSCYQGICQVVGCI